MTWNPSLALAEPLFDDSDESGLPLNWETCVYYWWYEYLRSNKAYEDFCVSHRKRRQKGHSFLELYDDFGDVHDTNFKKWWNAGVRGKELFGLDGSSSKFQIIESHVQLDDFPYGHPDILLLQVPLRTMGKRELRQAFNKVLREHHSGSTGKRKYESALSVYDVIGRPKPLSLKLHLAIHRYKEANKKVPHWKVFQHFELWNEENRARYSVPHPDTDSMTTMNITISRHLKKARALIHNVGLGRFPDYTTPKELML